MAISQKNQKLLENMAPNLIYAFIPQSEINRDTFGKYVDIVSVKRDSQRKFIEAVAGSNLYANANKFYDYTREQLEEVYGMSVQDIIYYLAKNGSLPAAKYEADSLAGIKASIGASEAFVQDVWNQTFGKKELNFNPSSGKLEIGGSSTYTSTNYDTFGNTWKNYYSPTGFSATALKVGNGYSLVSGSNGETAVNLNTGNIIANNQNNFWNNLNNALPAIQGLLATIFDYLKPYLKTPVQMSPSQVGDGWVRTYTGEDLTTALVLTGIVGGAVLLSNEKK